MLRLPAARLSRGRLGHAGTLDYVATAVARNGAPTLQLRFSRLAITSSDFLRVYFLLLQQLLLPRMGYLPCVADAISHHFGEVAPDAQRTLWLEETRSGEPLRW